MSDKQLAFEDMPRPVGDFILTQKDIQYMQKFDGAWFHYKDVCTLLQRYAASQPPAVKGAWVKVSERLPEQRIRVLVTYDNLIVLEAYIDIDGQWKFSDPAWALHDTTGITHWMRLPALPGESPTAAGDGDPRETIENILYATGKFFEEQCTELADIILKEIKGAGDGKEDAVAFGDWIGEQNYKSFRTTKHSPVEWFKGGRSDRKAGTTAQLYDIFKNRNQ